MAAAAWILLSDSLVGLLPEPVERVAQTLKGILFVMVTALTLYVLLYRWAEQMMRDARHAESAERTLGRVIGTVPVGVVLLNGERRITFMNPGAEDLLGAEAANSVGRRFDELEVFSGEQDAKRLCSLFESGSADGITLSAAQNGRAIIGRAVELEGGDDSGGWVVAVADISDAQQAAERSARLVRGYRFLAETLLAAARSSDRRQMFADVCRMAVEAGDFTAAWAVYRDSAGESPDVSVLTGGGPILAEAARRLERERGGLNGDGRATQGGILVSNDVAHDPLNPWAPAAAAGEFGSCATLASGEPEGQMVELTLFAKEPGHFDTDQIALLSVVRSSLGFAVQRITLDRKRLAAEEALLRSERDYRSLFESHPQPMWIYEIATLAFLAVNDAAVSKYGFSHEEFAAMRISDIRPKGDVARLIDNVTHVADGFDDAGIWTHVDKAGRVFPVHVYSHALEWDGRRAELVMAMEVARVE